MDFDEMLEQVLALVQRQGRVSYRAIKRRFNLDDDFLADLQEEILFTYPHVRDEDGRGLVWTDTPAPTEGPPPPDVSSPQGALSSVVWHPSDAERRQLTVLFCDLVDSTRLAGQLDPEDYREVVRIYQVTCADVIRRFEGHIAQYLGDGLLVYFGYPQAHEDDAQRAVHAGLGMLNAMQALNRRLVQDVGIQLAVRLGIHTGLVVVGEMGGGGRHEQLALGETPNVAARLQGIAAPDTLVISGATYHLVQGFFACQALGPQLFRGVNTPVPAYCVLRASEAQSRLDVAGAAGFTPLVGRESEVRLLLERWTLSQDGRGQVVLLRGEAGIGKSRLVEVLRERVIGEGVTRMAFRCSPYYQNSALYPVIDHLQRFLQWHRDQPPEAQLDMLERMLRTSRLPLAEVVPLFATLLSLPHPVGYPPLHLSPQRQKQKLHEALVAWLLEEAERQPVLAVWEDLHWADPSTLDVLSLVLDRAPTARMLTLLTCRPQFRPPWARRPPLTQLTLTRLGRAQVEMMITGITGGKALPAEVMQQIVAKTDGVPLFVEELVKMILESGLVREEAGHYELTGPLPPLAIPSTLHDSLMARLDRLSTARELAQLGAVLGREFSYELLRAVSPLDKTTLRQGLSQLVDAELVYQRGLPPRSRYVFKHALIQDAAYQSLLKSTRQQYHQRIAQVLEAQFPETTTTQPELLAHHYTEAGLTEHAIPYWQRAGQRANERLAYVEAISHLTKGLEVLRALPDTPERTQHELTLQLTLGVSLQATKGYTALEVEHTYTQAQLLCRQVGETPQLLPVLHGLYRFYLVRAEHDTAYELGQQCLRLAQNLQEPSLLLEAYRPLGITSFYLGQLVASRQYLEQAMGLYDPQQHRSHAFLYTTDPGATCLSFAALTLWHLGYPDQALQQSREAVRLAQELAHPLSQALVLAYAACFHQCRRDVDSAYAQAEAAIALSTEVGITQRLAQGTILRGWALVMQGQGEAGITQIRQGLTSWRAVGGDLAQPWFLALLAEAYGTLGKVEAGLLVLSDALELVHKHQERHYEAELHRLRGELLLTQGVPDTHQAEVCFHQALSVARSQDAKALELRAAMSLSRLWQQQGKRAEAYQLLAPIYNWFTEGVDTADLQVAKALLEVL